MCGRPEDSYSVQICWARCESFAFTHALRRKSRLVRETLSPSSLTAWKSSIPTSKFTGSISHIWQKTFRPVHASKQNYSYKNLQRLWFMIEGLLRLIQLWWEFIHRHFHQQQIHLSNLIDNYIKVRLFKMTP